MWRPALYWSPENRGSSTPTPANPYRIRPEQSNPLMLAPSSMPLLGPCSEPPPQEYGTPICAPIRRIAYSMPCRPFARGILPAPVLAGLGAASPPRLIPSPPRNCLPRSSVVWVACAVACSDWLATAGGSPGAPALIVAGRVGSHWPGSAMASGVGTAPENAKQNISPVTTVVIQAKLTSRNRLRRMASRSVLTRSPLDVTDHVGRHAAGTHGRNADLQTDVRSLEHLAVAQIDRHVLATARTVEDDVTAAHLRRRNLAAQVVLRTRIVRQLDAHPGERVQDQARAVEACDAGPGVDSLTRAGRVATAPGIGHADLRHTAPDHVFGGLASIYPRNPPPRCGVGDAGVVGLEDAQRLQEALPHVGGHLRRRGGDAEHLVDHRDGVTGDVGAGHHRQRGVPGTVPAAAAGSGRGRGRRPCLPPIPRRGRPGSAWPR